MTESTGKLQAALRETEQRRRKILRRLSKEEELAVGTVSWVRKACGGPGCHCAEGEGHRQLQFLWKDPGGRRRCQIIRKADQERLLRARARYAEFKEDLRSLEAMQIEEVAILVALKQARQVRYE